MPEIISTTLWASGAIGLLVLYFCHVNRVLTTMPEEARRLSPHRWTVDEIREAYKRHIESPIDVAKSLPLKQQRRYIVVGGSGLVGGWIVTHLIARGENPATIRILDLQAPRQELLNQGVAYLKTDISDEASVENAFSQPWPQHVAHLQLTVFLTAAVLRSWERYKIYLPQCTKVNVDGTRNVVRAAKNAGTSCLISTSSGSVGIHRPWYWIAPWTKQPKRIVQIMSESMELPRRHDEFFGNYAVSKLASEKVVQGADDPQSNFRTGCIRPTNAVYGIGGYGSVTGTYLLSGNNPSWIPNIVQSWSNAENVSLAHLLYEQRLIELSALPSEEKTKEKDRSPTSSSSFSPSLPDIGGQVFVICDLGPAPAFKDIYLLLSTLSITPTTFPIVPAVPMMLLAYLVEAYAFLQYRYLSHFLSPVPSPLHQLQPATLNISQVHVLADDRGARKSPDQGGLGYNPPLTTMDGLCRELAEWNRRAGEKLALK
ncbi:hypothetical protein ASPZODRAFT_1712425 [Penicilliopsis zonata CBS 506.65]|uniref:3-beta hydroxysteroid dehydrogenase/isomerase domain-containing protein n=1 Tax=Penicilliopsis zonata CBS 506.65 TaxID=1073090 RepID=A0A1L9SJY9_9EURO|nr:hypothetical protein ASPZODRAFT_1712425 [Penicilliopsis zonata CBS 506.65]OJJ47552.1 hypothetical protein ASPZODRAFT_1712425 [Penicilliopsis zonata CBS 506.65]